MSLFDYLKKDTNAYNEVRRTFAGYSHWKECLEVFFGDTEMLDRLNELPTAYGKTDCLLDLVFRACTEEKFLKVCKKFHFDTLVESLKNRTFSIYTVNEQAVEGQRLDDYFKDKKENFEYLLEKLSTNSLYYTIISSLAAIDSMKSVITQTWVQDLKLGCSTDQERAKLVLEHLGKTCSTENFLSACKSCGITL